MAKFRLLSDSMMTGPNREFRAHKGQEVEIEDDRRAAQLVREGAVVEESKATDEQKKLWENDTKASESAEADRQAIQRQEENLLKQGGRADNATKPKGESAQAPQAQAPKK